jgi:hypothetical protein
MAAGPLGVGSGWAVATAAGAEIGCSVTADSGLGVWPLSGVEVASGSVIVPVPVSVPWTAVVNWSSVIL